MSDKVENMENICVSASVVAKYIGVSERRIRQLAEEGICVREKTGRYNLQKSVYNYILQLKVDKNKNADMANEELDWETEKAKHEHIKMEISELKLARMQNTMHTSYDVQRVMNDMLGAMKSKLLNLPAKTAPIFAGNNFDYNTYIKMLGKEVRECLLELSSYNPIDFATDDFVGEEEENEDQ